MGEDRFPQGLISACGDGSELRCGLRKSGFAVSVCNKGLPELFLLILLFVGPAQASPTGRGVGGRKETQKRVFQPRLAAK